MPTCLYNNLAEHCTGRIIRRIIRLSDPTGRGGAGNPPFASDSDRIIKWRVMLGFRIIRQRLSEDVFCCFFCISILVHLRVSLSWAYVTKWIYSYRIGYLNWMYCILNLQILLYSRSQYNREMKMRLLMLYNPEDVYSMAIIFVYSTKNARRILPGQ